MTDHPRPSEELLDRFRRICMELPGVIEEQAWAGTRWCVRTKNFAHVVRIEDGWPPAYAKAAGTEGPVCVLTFRLPQKQLAVSRFSTRPFFRPPWFADIAGLVLGPSNDWDEIGRLIAGSYALYAPTRTGRSPSPRS